MGRPFIAPAQLAADLEQLERELELTHHTEPLRTAIELLQTLHNVPSDEQIMTACEEAGLWPNTAASWIQNGAFSRYHAAINRQLAASHQAPSHAVEWLFIAMDDDGVAHPTRCADRVAIFEAVKAVTWMPGHELDADEREQCSAIVDTLMEDGALHFEGDPPLHLFRLPAPRITAQEQKGGVT